MKKETVGRISNFLARHQIKRGSLATDEEIKSIEKSLGFTLNDQYIDFVKKFGGTYAGLGIHFINNNPEIGKSTVIEKTKWFRQSINNEKYSKCLVFSDDGAGNFIFLNENGNVMIYYHDSGDVDFLYESFEHMFDFINLDS